jgi:ABC-type bacteriocin/lantibiotic exporter with double-glycine peptidase domain
MLYIIHLTQLYLGLYNACGPACAAMVVNLFVRYRKLSVVQMAALVGNDGGFSTFNAVMRGLQLGGVRCRYEGNATIDWYIRTLAAGFPIIALVSYAAFTNRPFNYLLAHFIVVVGIDDQWVTAFDPLRLFGPYKFPRKEFERAISVRSAYPGGTNNPYQAIVPEDPLSFEDEILIELRRNMERQRELLLSAA